ncbi:hypothetical protein PTSG_00813 [Salpingoeca rosetta]|uniref:Uncharacterized protein n=1 Tax=Salpingoeca rosetta (strain ATCC 50818 / BSB-021) TaxID=946362 RepID=F2TXJ8_SALR5|nr:uncharacterized protein PTSG_00813 [Salpingoeca rosetta]EGD76107.1 hypothetical protein PTSG_00813 [Salpingoeca rosetta]|eukprot:XP_004998282.1 hypothetical protein PTSG_00813 [Salpingoeca rosetta]
MADARVDGRKAMELRPMQCDLALLDKPDGSASFSFGDSSVMAAVYGPRDVPLSREKHDRSTVEVAWHSAPDNEQGAALQSHLTEFVVNALASIHDFPRSAIRVVIQELNNDGGMLACAINATCLALMDAGISLTAMFAAASCAVVDGQLILDPTLIEQNKANAVVVTGACKQASKVNAAEFVALHSSGPCAPKQMVTVLEAVESATAAVAAFLRTAKSK